jgi:hypothetical protein
MSRLRGLIAVLTAALLAFGAAVVAAPRAVFDAAPGLERAVAAVDPSLALLALAGLLGVLTLFRGASGRSAAATPPPLTGDQSERPPQRSQSGFPVIGADIDAAYERVMDYENATATRRERARNDVESELRALAETVHAQQTGQPRDAAAEAVRAGEWTDDPRAAAFLAGEDGPTTPISLWLVDLLTGRDPFERGAERSLAAIREAQDDATGGARA